MSSQASNQAILLADITGSTPLYEDVGDTAAMYQISARIDQMAEVVRGERGTTVISRGDDLLCVFADPSSALRAAQRMLLTTLGGPLSVHAGLHYGPVIHARGDIYGDAVNLTARLAALAKPGELLTSGRFVAELDEGEAATLRPLESIRFKGKRNPVEVYSFLGRTEALVTDVAITLNSRPFLSRAIPGLSDVTVSLSHRDRIYTCLEHRKILVGRASHCDLVIDKPWVSRSHATIAVRRGKVEIVDQSTAGTYVTIGEGSEIFLHRETLSLTGSGIISPTVPQGDAGAEKVVFAIDLPRP